MNLQRVLKVENQLSQIRRTIMASDLHDQCHDDSSCGIRMIWCDHIPHESSYLPLPA